jgi:phage terminase large subunit GpA-like protein
MDIDFSIIAPFLDGLRPPEKLTITEWADRYLVLPSKSSALPGQYSSDKTPWIKEIMNYCSPSSSFQKIIIKKGVQLAFTQAAYNMAFYHMDVDPCPIMYVLPNEKTCKEHSTTRFDPTVEVTERLKDKVGAKRDRDGGNTKMTKDFKGGVFYYASANIADDLRSKPIRIIVMDEVSTWSKDINGEGSPVKLAEKRTSTFPNKKILMISSPTVEEECIISDEYEKTDKRKWMVPCPHCGSYQSLEFEQLRWEKGNYEKVTYECKDCNEQIQERYKTKMLANGKFVATDPSKASKRKVGIHMNSLYSPLGWYSWKEIAEEWDEAQNDMPLLKTFTNTVLGETWKENSEKPDEQRLWERREHYAMNKPPKEVVMITAGVDIQKDRIEVVLTGWAKDKQNYCIDYRVLPGDTATIEVWNKLYKVVNEKFIREDGAELPIRMTAVDIGYNTQYVYNFCKRFDETRVIPVDGNDKLNMVYSAPRNVDLTQSGKKIGKVRVYKVGVSLIKSELYGWLRMDRNEDSSFPACYCHYPQFDLFFFKSLTAEKLQTKTVKGYAKSEWIKSFARNEVLDCSVYARAAASVAGLDRMTPDQLEQMVNFDRKTEQKAKKSSFWDNKKDIRFK